jgi:hypothetical protein
LELFVASRLEVDSRSRFIVLVTAAEALCEQQDLGAGVAEALQDVGGRLKASASAIDDSTVQSLVGQISQLRRESVRRAMSRTLRSHGIGEEQIAQMEDAYTRRSKILHEGERFDDLERASAGVEETLRTVYQHVFQLPFGR